MGIYKEKHEDIIDPYFVEYMSKADGFGQDLRRETIRLIQLSEPYFTKKKIEQWINSNKVLEGHKKLFEILVVNE